MNKIEMDISKLKSMLIRHESLKLKPYVCTSGKITIGCSRNLEDKGISREEADFMLDNDIQDAIKDLKEVFVDFETFTENRQMALVDMIFNLGRAGFEKFEKTIRFIWVGSWKRASLEMLDSKWMAQVGTRAQELAWMIETG